MESPTAILPVDEARLQLRVDETDAEVTAVVEAAISDAVAHVGRLTGIPLIDRPSSPASPLRIPSQDVAAVTRLAYWSTSGSLADDPDTAWGSGAGEAALTELGRLDTSAELAWLAAHILSRVLSPEDELFRDGSESVPAPRPLRADPDDVAEVLVRDARAPPPRPHAGCPEGVHGRAF